MVANYSKLVVSQLISHFYGLSIFYAVCSALLISNSSTTLCNMCFTVLYKKKIGFIKKCFITLDK